MSRRLRDVATTCYGKSPKDVSDVDGEFPIIGTGGRFGQARKALFSGPAVVVPRKGSLGNPQYVATAFWPVDTTYGVIPRRGIDAKWLYYVLDLFDLTRLNEATGVPSIRRDWLERLPVAGTPDDEQPRVAEILSTADAAIEQAEALIAKTQRIKSGLMHDLFTRGVMPDGRLRPTCEEAPALYKESPIGWIPREWDCERLEDLLAATSSPMRSGPFGSALLKEELVDDGIPLLGIDNVFEERFVAEYRRFVTRKKFHELCRYAVFPGDVVITIMGTVGRCCVLPDGLGDALSSKHLWSMTFDTRRVVPELVCWQLNFAGWVKAWFARHAQGAVMDAIQSSTLRSLRLPVPPMPEQLAIMERHSACNAELSAARAGLSKLTQTKAGLMRDLLSGRVRVQVPPERAEAADV